MLHDFRYALRTLRSSPGFAAVTILSLALGIGANTAIFSLIDAVMLKSLPVSHPEELLSVAVSPGNRIFTNPLWEQLRDRQDVFSGLLAFGGTRFNLSTGGEAHYVNGIMVSGSYFPTLGLNAIVGRTLTTADDHRGCPATAMLSYGFWQSSYGANPSVIEKSISIDGHPFQVIGVAPPHFTGVDVGRSIDLFVPICAEPVIRGKDSVLDNRSSWWWRVIGRPRPGVSGQTVQARLQVLAPEIFGATVPPDWRAEDRQAYRRRSFTTAPASTGLSSLRIEYRDALFVLMGIVGVVLLIACANVANLLLARAAVRRKEIAIRLAIGAGRGRLVRQLLTESLLLSSTAAGLGILFAQWGSRLLVRFLSGANGRVFLDLALDLRVLSFTIAAALLTGILFGLAPAWRATRVEPQAAMKANARGVAEGHSRFTLGKALVAAQVALSLVLVVGAALMLGTFRNLTALDPGFEPGHVLLVATDLRNARYPVERLMPAFEQMRTALASIPGVRMASFSDNTPLSGNTSDVPVQVEGAAPRSRRDSQMWGFLVSPGYLDTLATPLLAGRQFDSHDTATSAPVAIVNQSAARKFFGTANPIGRFFRKGYPKLGEPIEIVGISKDATYRSLREDTPPTAYYPIAQAAYQSPYASFELRAASAPATLIPAVKAAMTQVNPDIALSFQTLSAQVSDTLTMERLLATLSGFFGGLALLLAAIGLYGVIGYDVARRRHEIGIRMALGCGQGRVLSMVLRDVALLLSAGLFLGLAAAAASTRFLTSFLYGLKATDPAMLAIAAAVLGIVALLAGFLPARRASRVDPMLALREE